MSDFVWMCPPYGQGEPKRIEAKPDAILPLMNSGWSQCDPPETQPEVKNVDD